MLDASIRADDDGFRLAYDPTIAVPLQVAAAQEGGIQDMDLWKTWEQVHCPVLVLRGGRSDVLSADTAERMKKKDGVMLIEYPDVGHAPSLLEPQQIAAVIAWLNS
jgi:pimeloyl-ACP methyl ester carboxylesterase